MTTHTAKAATAALTAAATLVVSGCSDPYARQSPTATRPVAGEQPAPTVHHGIQHAQRSDSPTLLARRAATLTGAWAGPTVAANYRELARISVGEARADALTTAARLPSDVHLIAPGSTSAATIAAIIDRPPHRAPTRRLLIVTHERLTTDGSTTSRYRVTLATAVRHGEHGWALQRWEPQP